MSRQKKLTTTDQDENDVVAHDFNDPSEDVRHEPRRVSVELWVISGLISAACIFLTASVFVSLKNHMKQKPAVPQAERVGR